MKIIAFLCLLGATPLVQAQESSPSPAPTPPSEPLLERAPAFARWTITSKIETAPENRSPVAEPSPASAPSPAAENSAPVEGNSSDKPEQKKEAATPPKSPAPIMESTVVVTKTKALRYEQITANGGEKSERWCLPNIQVTVQAGGNVLVSLPSKAEDSSFINYSETDFPDFVWISSRNFVGIEQVNEQECHVFRAKIKGNGKSSVGTSEWTARINTATRLPVTLQIGEETRTYEFGVAPTAMIKLPPNVAAKVEEWEKSVEQSTLMPAKP